MMERVIISPYVVPGLVKKLCNSDRVPIIKQLVCEELGVLVEDLPVTSRKRHLVQARMYCMYLLWQYTTISLTRIGGLLGGRDHATVIYGRMKIEDNLKYYTEDRNRMERITTKLLQLNIHKVTRHE